MKEHFNITRELFLLKNDTQNEVEKLFPGPEYISGSIF